MSKNSISKIKIGSVEYEIDATTAAKDSTGNIITETYATKTDVEAKAAVQIITWEDND